jgi:hypothetical protein
VERSWSSTWKWVAAALACVVLGWFPLIRDTRVPLLGLVDLGFHELGHLLTYPLPDVWTAAMGSITQIAVPLGIAIYFLWRRGDLASGAVCLAWAGTSAVDAAVYVADAPFQRLELIGGEHDWAFVLGRLGLLDAAGSIASVVRFCGVLLVIAGLGCCGYGWWRGRAEDARSRRLADASAVGAIALDRSLVPPVKPEER